VRTRGASSLRAGALVLGLTLLVGGCGGEGGATVPDAATDLGGRPDVGADVPAAPDVLADAPTDTLPDAVADDVPADVPLTDASAGDGGPIAYVWQQVPAPLDDDNVLHAVWGSAPDTLFAVGVAGTVLRWEGGRWALSLREPTLDILNGVAGSGPGDAWAVGMRGRALRFDGARWRVPDACAVDVDCAPDDPCRVGTCDQGTCDYRPTKAPGCCGAAVAAWDFDDGAQGFGFADLYGDDPDHGGIGWQTASLTDPESGSPRYTSSPAALYFGVPDRPCPDAPARVCPDYDNGRKVGGTATSPPFALPADAERATLAFQLFLDVEASVHYDVLEVQVVDGGQVFPVWRKAELPNGTTRGRFLPVTADLSPFVGRTVAVRFHFDTREQTDNDFEGVYVDDIRVDTTCGALEEGIGVSDTLWGVAAAPGDRTYFAVGGEGTILRHDGRRWRRMMGGGELPLGIAGSSVEDMHVVGRGGLALRGPKGGWMQVETGVTAVLEGIWAASPSLALAVGERGAALRWNGATWEAVPSGSAAALHAVHGSGPADALAVGDGGTVLAWTGSGWGPSPASGLVNWNLRGVARLGPGQSWIVGDGGVLLRETAPGQWQNVPTGVNETLHDVVAFPTGEVLAAGVGGRFVHRTPDGAQDTGLAAGARTVFALDGTSRTDIWGVGLGGIIIHWDGSVWSQYPTLIEDAITDVYAAAPDEVWAVAEGGTMLRWDGRKWAVVRSTTAATLRGVWAAGPSRAVAVGGTATILHFDGVNWLQRPIEPVEIPGEDEPWVVDAPLHGVWGAAADDVWAVGGQGVVVHFDGERWTYTPTADDRRRTLWAVWGRAADDVWAVGGQGVVLHWDGSAWSLQPANSVATLFGVWGLGADVWAVGSLGTILRHVP
jgi:hypothetical protein